jgi:serine/threonine protein kinase
LRPEVAGVIGAARFLREIQIAAQLTHPRVVPLYDSGRSGRWTAVLCDALH